MSGNHRVHVIVKTVRLPSGRSYDFVSVFPSKKAAEKRMEPGSRLFSTDNLVVRMKPRRVIEGDEQSLMLEEL